MNFESVEQLIKKYEKLKKDELNKSFPFDFGVVESMQRIECYEEFIKELKQIAS